jgi:hypothetical protein
MLPRLGSWNWVRGLLLSLESFVGFASSARLDSTRSVFCSIVSGEMGFEAEILSERERIPLFDLDSGNFERNDGPWVLDEMPN